MPFAWTGFVPSRATAVPPVVQVPLAIGPQRWNESVPLKLPVPPTSRSALSVTCTEPDPIETSGIPLLLLSDRSAPAAFPGVVVRPELQDSNFPSRKSFSCAPIDGEERVSARK